MLILFALLLLAQATPDPATTSAEERFAAAEKTLAEATARVAETERNLEAVRQRRETALARFNETKNARDRAAYEAVDAEFMPAKLAIAEAKTREGDASTARVKARLAMQLGMATRPMSTPVPSSTSTDPSQRIRACSSVQEKNARLTCFDAIAMDLARAPAAPAALIATARPAAIAQPAPRSQAISSQCAAITKKGTRCSRRAKAGSAYCWQHP